MRIPALVDLASVGTLAMAMFLSDVLVYRPTTMKARTMVDRTHRDTLQATNTVPGMEIGGIIVEVIK
jgi:hypothetical protein